MIAFLDANALIYLIEGAPPLATRVQARLRAMAAAHGVPQLAVSALSRLECRVGPLKSGDVQTLADYDAFFARPDLIQVALSTQVIDLAAAIRARYGIKTPDALQAASCLQTGPEHQFITGDRAFGRIAGLCTQIL